MHAPKAGTVLRAAGWLAGWWLLWRLPAPDPLRPGRMDGTPGTVSVTGTVSVIIPARNEERSLPRLLVSLAAQTAAPFEVIVVDDHSDDQTASLGAAAGATVIAGAPLPSGWTGKTWACAQGAGAASGDLLWFLDADVTLAPDALARLRGVWERRGGLVSVQPFHDTELPYESLSAVCNLAMLMGTGAFSGPPRRPAAMAFGPCLLIDRRSYEALGGHAHHEVRRLIAEDIGLARRARAEGVPVGLFAGRDVVRFRMYPDGAGQLLGGWHKMLAYGALRTPLPLAAAVGMWVAASLLVTADVVSMVRYIGRLGRGRGPGRGDGAMAHQPALPSPAHRPASPAAAGAYAGWTLQVWWMLRRVGRFHPWAVAAWPVPVAAFVGMTIRSLLSRGAGRAPRWRGRLAPRA